MKRNRGSILAGIVLIAIGAWLLADRLGASLPGLGALWPGFIILGGVIALISFFRERKPDQLFFGVAAPLVGGFFFMFTLGRWEWAQMRDYWPVFLIIAAVASLAEWIAAQRRNLIIQAAIFLFVGLFFFAYNLKLLNQTLADQILKLWPLALVVLGLIVLVRAIRRAN